MNIAERVKHEKDFKIRLRNKYSGGIPEVKKGDKVNTIYGEGIVSSVYYTPWNAYPRVKFDKSPISVLGEPFAWDVLTFYPFEYELIKEK